MVERCKNSARSAVAEHASREPVEHREVVLRLDEQEARDVLLALKLRDEALRDARGGFRSPMRWKADRARERVQKLIEAIAVQLPGVHRG